MIVDTTGLVIALEAADVFLSVKLDANSFDQIELGFEEIDVVFLVRHQLLEQVACYIVPRGVAVRRGFLVERAGGNLRRQGRS